MANKDNQYSSYSPQQPQSGSGYSDSSSTDGYSTNYDSYGSQGGGYNDSYSTNYDSYGSQGGGYNDSYSQSSSSQGGGGGYNNSQPYNDSKKGGSNGVKIVMFLVPIIIAAVATVGLLLEMSTINVPAMKPSKIFGIDVEKEIDVQIEKKPDYNTCVEDEGVLTAGYPSMCIVEDTIYFKNYLVSEKLTDIKFAEKELAENGFILFAPSNYDSLSKVVEVLNVDTVLPTYYYGDVRSDMPYKMIINNAHLVSSNSENDILVDDVVSFIETGAGYDGEEPSVVRAFNSQYQTHVSYILDEISVTYPNSESVRAVYTIDHGDVQGRIFVKVFAQKRDNVILLEKELAYQTYTTQRNDHLMDCIKQGLGVDQERLCLLDKLGSDTTIKNEALKEAQKLIDSFILDDVDFQIK